MTKSFQRQLRLPELQTVFVAVDNGLNVVRNAYTCIVCVCRVWLPQRTLVGFQPLDVCQQRQSGFRTAGWRSGGAGEEHGVSFTISVAYRGQTLKRRIPHRQLARTTKILWRENNKHSNQQITRMNNENRVTGKQQTLKPANNENEQRKSCDGKTANI